MTGRRLFRPETYLQQTWTEARLLHHTEMFLLLATAIILLFVAGIWIRNARADDAPPVMATITVRSGDTLWNLADEYGDPSQYILERVDTLKRINKLKKGHALYEGQTLVIPVGNKSAKLYYGGKYANREIAD